MRDILRNPVVSGKPGDCDRYHRSRILFAEEWCQRFQYKRLKTGCRVRNILVHLEVAGEVHSLVVEPEGSAERGFGTGHPEADVRRRYDTVRDLRRPFERRKDISLRQPALCARFDTGVWFLSSTRALAEGREILFSRWFCDFLCRHHEGAAHPEPRHESVPGWSEIRVALH